MLLLDESDFPPMFNLSDNAVGAIGCFFVFGLPVLVWFASRYMKHRERMAMIARGMTPPPSGRGDPPPPAYPPGATYPGAATPSAPRGRGGRGGRDDETPDEQLRGGIRLAFIGAAITFGLSFMGHGPWLLGGLIPLFIGISQIVNGVLSGADISAFRGGGSGAWGWPPNVPPAAPPPPPGGSAGYDASSYRYRPGVPEIEPPPRPPDARR